MTKSNNGQNQSYFLDVLYNMLVVGHNFILLYNFISLVLLLFSWCEHLCHFVTNDTLHDYILYFTEFSLAYSAGTHAA